MIRAVFDYGTFLRLLVVRDLRLRYAGSLLGSFWNVINPLIMVGIYILVFGQVMTNMKVNGPAVEKMGGLSRLDYATHLCAGIIPWLLFSEILARSGTILLENANFLRKLAFPAEILPISVFINAMLLHSISAVFLVGLLVGFGQPMGANAALYLLVMLGMGLTALGLGMIVAVVNVYLRDFAHIVAITLQFLFWMLPILWYREDMGPFIRAVFDYNPLSYYIVAGQQLLHSSASALSPRGHPLEGLDPQHVPHMVLLPLVSLVAGYTIFRRHRRAVLDEL